MAIMQPKFRNWQRSLGAPEDPVATDTSSEWSAMSLLKAIYANIVSTSGSQTLTNKTIDGDDNTLRDIATSSLKTRSGADGTVITGTKGSTGELAGWNVDGDAVGSGYFPVDEDDFASNSATKLPTQQSVKAYVDNLATRQAADRTELASLDASVGDVYLAEEGREGLFKFNADLTAYDFSLDPEQGVYVDHATSNGGWERVRNSSSEFWANWFGAAENTDITDALQAAVDFAQYSGVGANNAGFTGSISGTTLTVTAGLSSALTANMRLSSPLIDANTVVIAAISVDGSGIGTYQLNISQTVASTTIKAENIATTNATSGRSIIIPAGYYKILGTITVSQPCIGIHGVGPDATEIDCVSSTEQLFIFAPCQAWIAAGLQMAK